MQKADQLSEQFRKLEDEANQQIKLIQGTYKNERNVKLNERDYIKQMLKPQDPTLKNIIHGRHRVPAFTETQKFLQNAVVDAQENLNRGDTYKNYLITELGLKEEKTNEVIRKGNRSNTKSKLETEKEFNLTDMMRGIIDQQ
ncbi:Hypothetical_protein [Hexamita inflata]|uniref:Hypothetical_protein n=1 Tax=Hexamita inflata TaxID=28002 RepID=A0AA86NMJ0_9EUKA|nr:Hypothetical protein HINF_LOCUS9371 [Hexamita inflata]